MKKATTITLVLALTLILTACGTVEIKPEDVKKVTLTIGQADQKVYKVVILKEKKNIKKTFTLEKKLQKYNPNKDLKTLKADIKIQYYLHDGTIIEKFYQEIGPVSKYLEDIYSSKEYREQAIPLFKIDKGEITRIRFGFD